MTDIVQLPCDCELPALVSPVERKPTEAPAVADVGRSPDLSNVIELAAVRAARARRLAGKR